MTYIPSINNKVDNNNSSVVALGSNGVFTGVVTDVTKYSSIFINVFADQNSAIGGLTISFSTNGTDFSTTSYNTFSYMASTFFTNTSEVLGQYYKITFTNGTVAQTTFRLQVILDAISSLTTSRISGLLPNGADYREIKSTSSGALAVAIATPTTAFGEVSMAQNETSVQGDYVYGINTDIYRAITSGTGSSVTSSNNLAIVSSGTVASSLGYLQSLRNSRYKSGQGLVGRFTTIFSAGVNGNNQLSGLGNFKSGVYFGYKNTTFGINRLAGGTLAIQTLTVTSVAANGVATINLFDGATTRAFSVTLTTPAPILAPTAPQVPQTAQEITAAQIANFNFTTLYPGWIVSSNGAVVTFICMLAQPNTLLTFSGAGLTATTSSVTTGVVPSGTGAGGEDEFVPQSQWNQDVMDGTNSTANPSGLLLDPTKGNVYQISIQYLGFGGMVFSIEDPLTRLFTPVHVINYANQYTATNLKVPNMSFQMFSRNTTNTTAVVLRSASNYIGIQGIYKNLGTVRSYSWSQFLMQGAGIEYQMFAIRPSVIYNGQYSVINIIPTALLLANDEADSFRINIYLSPTTYNAPTNSWSNAALSPTATTSMLIAQQPQVNTGGGGPVAPAATGGTLILSLNVPTSSSQVIDLRPYNLVINYFQTLNITYQSVAQVVPNVWSVGINWIEEQ
jgi:hypothetical protein